MKMKPMVIKYTACTFSVGLISPRVLVLVIDLEYIYGPHEVADIKEQVCHLTYRLLKVLAQRDYTCSWKCPIYYRYW